MKPKERAEELFNKFYPRATSYSSDRKNQKDNAKQCVLIAVDEILELIRIDAFKGQNACKRKYWEEVKSEIEKL
jgi:hypothetical protein